MATQPNPDTSPRVVMHPAQFRAGFTAPPGPTPARLFVYYWTITVDDGSLEGRLVHRSRDYRVVDEWSGSAADAHADLARDLERIVPADHVVSIFGGYV